MASYWKSLPKKYCEYCSCWITDNKASVEFHERGKKHLEKKEKKIAQIRKKSHSQFTSDKDTAAILQQMEVAALESYKKDLSAQGITLVGKYSSKYSSVEASAKVSPLPPVNDPRPRGSVIRKSSKMAIIEPRIIPRESAWKEQKSPEGYIYYWNTENGKTQWEKPLGFVSKSDLEPIKDTPIDYPKTIVENSSNKKDSTTKTEEKAQERNTKKFSTKREIDNKESEAKPQKAMRVDPYGAWSSVTDANQSTSVPQKPKAPELLYKPITSIPKEEQPLMDEKPEVRNFEEKVAPIHKDHDETSSSIPTVFKKKSFKQRSIRKRT